MFLGEIIGEVKLKDGKFEVKLILNREDIVGWLKTVSSFANAGGGEFLIGVRIKQTNSLDLIGKVLIVKETILRKEILENMEKSGYLEKSKMFKATYYKTNPDMVIVL